MALNTLKCNYLTPLGLKGLIQHFDNNFGIKYLTTYDRC